MHISEGVLPTWEIVTGWGLTLIGTAIGLRKLEGEKLVLAALLTSLFFVASLIHVPIGVGSAHLLFNGFIGLILGWAAFPTILIGLLFQALLFQFGGLMVLGVNTFNMAFPAVIAHYLFKDWIKTEGWKFYAGAFLSAFVAILGAGLLVAIELALAGEKFIKDAELIFLIHIPIATVEGIIYIFLLKFLKKTYPQFLED
ncbi:MAG: cobalt transporter CbiM [Aquificae bacterium]|nr:cobalt transporter CbiM [Aquificota bacterium]